MPHVLLKLVDVKYEDVKRQLELDAAAHAEQGMHLEHLWRNDDQPDEVLFLFRVGDLEHCKQMMTKTHAAARAQNPDAKLPHAVFLNDA